MFLYNSYVYIYIYSSFDLYNLIASKTTQVGKEGKKSHVTLNPDNLFIVGPDGQRGAPMCISLIRTIPLLLFIHLFSFLYFIQKQKKKKSIVIFVGQVHILA